VPDEGGRFQKKYKDLSYLNKNFEIVLLFYFKCKEEQMRKLTLIRRFLIMGLLLISTAGIALHGAIPASERAALIALYKATNGDHWVNNSGWKGRNNEPDGFSEKGSEGNWYGITVYTRVTSINLELNGLNGDIPAQLGNLSELYEIDLSNNNLSGSIPRQLGNLNNLRYMYLSNNQLTGSIPPEFGNLSSLYWFDLSSNKLSGSIPPELANLSTLTLLFLDNNQLTGSIPPELGNLDLWYFVLGQNELTGTIPPELGNFSGCFKFDLSRNHLTGSIPPELGNLTEVGLFWLDSNQLTGDIPSSLTNLKNLLLTVSSGIQLGYNALYATDPAVWDFLFSRSINWETTQTIAPIDVSAVTTSDTSIKVTWDPIIYTDDTGGYMVYYSTVSGGPYTYSGITADKSATSYDVTGLGPGRTYYLVVKAITNPHSSNNNTVVSETSEEVFATTTGSIVEIEPPFGAFETPLEGSTVSGSIAVTGWALDDSGVAGITIYREVDSSLFYVGDAVRVEGARPDVAASYPEYPENTMAGWGYMMLTNYLPNGGNGTFILHAIAVDTAGKSTTLGTKTIICDNANAVKPFGAIDTPIQGGTASGAAFKNWGWALTPQPNSIPTDGSTINVFVDGVNIGNPTYDLYREDIVELFPGYANSDGAVGYFNLDTTVYTDGVHTISWSVEDDAGNSDGIGSRYFSVQNSSSPIAWRRAHSKTPTPIGAPDISDIPADDSSPVLVKRGYNPHIEPIEYFPDDNGIITIEIRELERIEIWVGARHAVSLQPLPIGSTLDTQRGIFYWQPGPGFLGNYRFVFIEKGTGKIMRKKEIVILITP
jgi:hypothetical protein